ncbi:MAG: hypothetical protein VKP70_03185 [Cyanobacteriota bacterium]|nr:hypothetical protein [Cyanobacteriota bacterium]
MKALPSWCRIPVRPSPGPTLPRVPLALTLTTTLLLLLVPALLLRRLPRPQALGLEKVMANVSLLQSFAPNPERPVPDLWRQRLGGPLAERLWRLQTRSWWQFWGGQGGEQPFLAISSRGLEASSPRALPVAPLQVGDLAIFSPDPPSRQWLGERLRNEVRPSPGLRFRCLPRLEREQAVFWRPAALGVLLGPLAPFLQTYQEGCLSLAIQADGLSWSGEAASVEGMLLEAPQRTMEQPRVTVAPPGPTDALLEVQGGSLERLFAGLLAREPIRQPLAERYGFGQEQIALLRHTPFRLVLRPLAAGPFQASMELTVQVAGKETPWRAALGRLARNLERQGLHLLPAGSAGAPAGMSSGAPAGGSSAATPGGKTPSAAPAAAPPSSGLPPSPGKTNPGSANPETGAGGGAVSQGTAGSKRAAGGKGAALVVWPSALWAREDGVVVGGWQRRSGPGQPEQITFFLGPKPALAAAVPATPLPAGDAMRLLARPRELALRGLLPQDLPEVVKRSAWLWVSAEPMAGGQRDSPLSQLQGSLGLRP